MQNLNQLFSKSSPSQTADAIRLHHDLVSLFKRTDSSQWQCRFKLPNGQWHSMSTGQVDIEAAKQEAVAIYERVMAKIRQELSLKSKSFKVLAMEELADLARASGEGKGKSVYRDYAFVINKYFIPFFGSYQLTQITPQLVQEFESWRYDCCKSPCHQQSLDLNMLHWYWYRTFHLGLMIELVHCFFWSTLG